MKAAWFITINKDNSGEPDLPDVGGSYVNPLDIYVIDGAQHRHTLVGGSALRDANLSELPDGYHTHLVLRLENDTWYQEAQPSEVQPHTHDLNLVDGEIVPNFFMLFWKGTNQDAQTIANHPGVIYLAQAEITDATEEGEPDLIGSLINDTWDSATESDMRNKFLNQMGIDLPDAIHSGKRLVQFLCGSFLARAGQQESALRYTQF